MECEPAKVHLDGGQSGNAVTKTMDCKWVLSYSRLANYDIFPIKQNKVDDDAACVEQIPKTQFIWSTTHASVCVFVCLCIFDHCNGHSLWFDGSNSKKKCIYKSSICMYSTSNFDEPIDYLEWLSHRLGFNRTENYQHPTITQHSRIQFDG